MKGVGKNVGHVIHFRFNEASISLLHMYNNILHFIWENYYKLLFTILASSTTHLTYLTKYVGHNVWQEIPFRKQDHKATSRYVLHGTVALLDTGCSIRKICILKIKWDPKKYPLVLENTHHKVLNFSFHADLFISWMNKVVRNEKL